MQIEIDDDGCGFMTQKALGSKSFGIMGMRERASSIGASFEIISKIGQGTNVRLVISCKGRGGSDEISYC
jgi:signal transduction histidine kinase